uniref:GAF domain-containing protein n=1 Tax=Amphora coffeiformis TaxID=265554 RepID=A0A7S3PD62_9STRA
MISGKSTQLVRLMMAQRQHHPKRSSIGRMIRPKRLSSVVAAGGSVDRRSTTICGKKMAVTSAGYRGSSNTVARRKTAVLGKRLSTTEAGNNAAAITSEETAQQLNQLLQQPLALETFITKELTSSQREAIQRLLEKSDVDTVEVPEPSMASLRLVAINTSIPFVGFGIMDNAIMILAGDMIDTSLGVALGISTMCAAAIGNIVSDVAGVMLGTVVEDFCARYLDLPTPVLSTAQRQLASVRFANQFGCAVGLIIGCIIGMFPLLFIDSNKIQARKREAAMDAIFRDVMDEASSLIGARRTCLYVLCSKEPDNENALRPNSEGKYLYAKYGGTSTSQESARVITLGRGIVSRAALTGESWNIENVLSEPDFVKEEAEAAGDEAKSMLCVPVLDGEGKTIAVIQALGKMSTGKEHDTPAGSPSVKGFSNSDVQVLKALASHISVSLQHMYEVEAYEESARLQDAIRIMKESGISKGSDDQKRIATRQLFPDG